MAYGAKRMAVHAGDTHILGHASTYAGKSSDDAHSRLIVARKHGGAVRVVGEKPPRLVGVLRIPADLDWICYLAAMSMQGVQPALVRPGPASRAGTATWWTVE